MTWLKYRLERQLLRGGWHRLGFIALIIIAVSFVGGGLALLVAPQDFPTSLDAVWWAFLRLSDPGYLGDDRGLAKRTVSTVLTVAGYVLFMGSLVAIMSQWLQSTLANLERGETPIAVSGHLLVVGWSERSAAVVEEFLFSQARVRTFLGRGQGKRALVVLLIEDLDAQVQAEVRLRLGPAWHSRRVLLRSGSRLKLEHLERVCFHDAAAIVLPGNHEAEYDGPDIATIKTLMTIAHHPLVRGSKTAPRVVAELTDQRKAPLADFAYPGELDVIPSDLHLARLVVQNVLNPGLSSLYTDLLSFRLGAAIYVANHPELAGLALPQAAARFTRTVLIGLVRDGKALLGLAPDIELRATDHLIVVASTYDEITPDAEGAPLVVDHVETLPVRARSVRVLCVGWSERVPAIVQEFGAHAGVTVAIDLIGITPTPAREAAIASYGPLPPGVSIRHLDGDYTVPAVLRALDPHSYDAALILGSSRNRTNEEVDARTLVTYLALREVLGETVGPPTLVELTDPRNEALFDGRPGEVMVSPTVVSSLLAHVTLRRELLAVYNALFSAGGASFRFRPASCYGLKGTPTFAEIRAACARLGHVAVGVRHGKLTLVPPPETRLPAAEVAVLAPCEA